jgi:Holliday junction resolvase
MPDKGLKAEREVARKIRGRRTPASGALGGQNDIITNHLSVEVKASAKGVRITETLLDKVRKRALMEGRSPALCLKIGKYTLWAFFEEALTFGDDTITVQ